MRTKAIRATIAIISLLILGISIATANANASHPLSNSTSIQPQSPSKASSLFGCAPSWNIVPSVELNNAGFARVSAISEDDVWAVGGQQPSGSNIGESLIEHWDGSTWSVIPNPDLGPLEYGLTGVSAVASNDVWATGSSFDFVRKHTLIEHWDGSTWSVVPSPDVAPYHNEFNAVKAISANDVWAVGTYSYQDIGSHTLIEHWDGISWSIVPSPDIPNAYHYLSDVTAVASDDVWAVGYYGDNSALGHTFIEHWNGTEWTIVPSPNVGGNDSENRLRRVDARSANDIWAVGYYRSSTYIAQTLILHWDGTSWTVTNSPTIDTNHNSVSSITAIAEDDAWAVGSYYNDPIGGISTFVLHWDGIAWDYVSNPASNIKALPSDIDAISSDDIWIVGQADFYNPIVQRYYSPPSCVPTPTPEPPRCPGEHFTDVCPSDYFYQHVLDLNDLGILSGYNTIPPCESPAHVPCFKPYNWTTRGQVAKVVSLAAGFTEPPGPQQFEDVPPGHTFYDYIWRLADRGILWGYPCGGFGEPCVGYDNRPYFRPANNVSRAQLTKIVSNAFGYTNPVTTQTFEDVLPGSTFYDYVERLATRLIINGYPCGDPEPCIAPNNRPYFRPATNISRGQVAKIVNLARTLPPPTPTSTRTPLPTRTPTTIPTPGTPSPTPTCSPSTKGWSSGHNLPNTLTRALGVYFPPNGKFYALGGRTGDGDPNLAQRNPLEYDPMSNTWITRTATFSDNNTSNTMGGVVNMDNTPVIIVVGGSPGTASGGTTETRAYNPVDDTLTTLAADPWPPGETTVPGGAAVVDNKLYILGGFVINVEMSSEIWEFNPEAGEGSRWTLLPTALPQPLGYIPTTSIDNIIYIAGGSSWDGGNIVDTDTSYSFDPASGIITPIAAMPRITGETEAVNINGKMWVLGGGRIDPNPSNEVDIYDPSTDQWTTGLPFAGPRRNIAADADPQGNIYLAGGYNAQAVPMSSLQLYTPLITCETPTSVPTTSPTATFTPGGPTPTITPTSQTRSGS